MASYSDLEPQANVILPMAALWVFATIGGGAPTDFDRQRQSHRKTSVGSITGQLTLVLNLNHSNEQEKKSEKSS